MGESVSDCIDETNRKYNQTFTINDERVGGFNFKRKQNNKHK